MNEKEKKAYLEEYQEAKKKGVLFFPDILYKDAIISLVVFIVLIVLAFVVGAKLEARADPSDSSYIPRPEWYFLFLFQLLKYFPGNLEVIGVVIIPMIAFAFLILLPYLDKSPKRHFLNRPIFTGIISLGVIGIIALTLLAVFEEPTGAVQAETENQAALLYLENCVGCHGDNIDVPADVSLHTIIAQGKHEGMPAWNADLSPDEIDALAGFILRPEGSKLFAQYCAECHDVTELVESDPFQLKFALDEGTAYQPHEGLDIPEWLDVLGSGGRTALLNFLIAPDGERLYTVYCSSCHGSASAFSLAEDELRDVIEQGGQHVSMPAWSEQLSDADITVLAAYVVNPAANPDGAALFEQHCQVCHSDVVPSAADVDEAAEIIMTGGPHRTMPIWGEVLTAEQVDALMEYMVSASDSPPVEIGQQLYNDNCAFCHGEFGEGGVNPAQTGDIIAPISSAEYLQTRDDFTLRSIIAQGQPNFGMSPFSVSNGGPLDDDEIDTIVAYMRSWEANPPVEFPPEISADVLSLSAPEIFNQICAQCHGLEAEGGTGPSLVDAQFREQTSRQEIVDSITYGHEATPMLAWGEILSSTQIEDLVDLVLSFEVQGQEEEVQPTSEAETAEVSFSDDVLPILANKCNFCHGTMGGWDGTTYESVINSGDNGPAVIPGDAENSLLAQKLLGTHEEGDIMPPTGKMADATVQTILDWIAAGAPDN